jgi:hypothetical protein
MPYTSASTDSRDRPQPASGEAARQAEAVLRALLSTLGDRDAIHQRSAQ